MAFVHWLVFQSKCADDFESIEYSVISYTKIKKTLFSFKSDIKFAILFIK